MVNFILVKFTSINKNIIAQTNSNKQKQCLLEGRTVHQGEQWLGKQEVGF